MKKYWMISLALWALLGITAGASEIAPKPVSDTPEAIGDPEALRLSIPGLKEQRLWTEFATEKQIKMFEGPQTEWPVVPFDKYDLNGFDAAAIGSKVPAPGIHPRVLFSPEDVPGIFQKLKTSKAGRKALLEARFALDRTIWNARSGEGKIFIKLSTGDLSGLEWPEKEGVLPGGSNAHYFKGYEQQMKSSIHSGYLPHLLDSAAFLCLLEEDAALGKAVATAIANYYKLREPLIDRLNGEYHEKRVMPNDEWRPMHQLVGNNNLGFCYDVAAPFMTEEQKTLMRRVISKATKGKLAYGMNGPTRWRDTNWVGWDLEHFLVALAIEGEEGYDAALYPVARETARAYLDWGMNEYGAIFETNGKNGAGLRYALLTLAALARRGDNLFGHPHLKKLTAMQAQSVIPAGGVSMNNGTWGNARFGNASEMKTFYPSDPCADWLLRQHNPDQLEFDLKVFEEGLKATTATQKLQWDRFDIMIPARVFDYQDWQGFKDKSGRLKEAWMREDLKLPVTFNDPNHGLLMARTNNDKDALFLMFEARPDLRGVGHQHHDSGSFYLAALGELWAAEAGAKNSYSSDHNTVLIDGVGHSDVSAAPRVEWLGAIDNENGVIASANLKNAYDYGWTTPMHFSWNLPDNKKGLWKLQPDTSPELVSYYKGTRNVKMRIWGDTYWQNNWGPCMRIEGNPVQYAFRSAGMARGKHPYAIIADDICKDGKPHTYDWLMQVPDSLRLTGVSMPKGSAPCMVLTKAQAGDTWGRARGPETLPKGSPALLVCLLDAESATATPSIGNVVKCETLPFRLEQQAVPAVQPGQSMIKSELVITRKAVDPRFKIALIPFRGGEAPPAISWDRESGSARIAWKDQTDTLVFRTGNDQRTQISLSRNGKAVLEK